jgi:acyl dehydratase
VVKEIMEVTGDKNPIYWNEAAAKSNSLPGRIAPQAAAMIFGRLSYLAEK